MRTGSSIASVPVPEHVPGRVRLWRVDLDRYAALTPLEGLSVTEEARARAMAQVEDRGRFRAAHHAVRSRLGAVLGRDGRDIEFEIGPFGRPSVAREPGVHFSLSHSEGTALIGLGEGPIGVDVEVLRAVPEREALAEAHCTAEELAWWHSTDPADRDGALLAVWTRKEAVAKALGVGLSLPPHRIETVGPAAPRARLGGAWWPMVVAELPLGRRAVAAVALADQVAVAEAQRTLTGRMQEAGEGRL